MKIWTKGAAYACTCTPVFKVIVIKGQIKINNYGKSTQLPELGKLEPNSYMYVFFGLTSSGN